jgi:sialic acid synthase SpsE
MRKLTQSLSAILAVVFVSSNALEAVPQQTQPSKHEDPGMAEFERERAALEAKMKEKVSCAYAIKDIKTGETLTKTNVQDCQVENRSRPADAIANVAPILGGWANKPIHRGQYISQHDIKLWK